MPETARPLWFFHLMALATITIWSFSFLFIIQLNREMTPVGVVVLRMDIFGLFLLGLLAVRRPRLRGLSRKQWAIIIGLSLVGGPLYHNVFSWSAGVNAAGVSRLDPALLGLILATVPVHTGWMARLALGERLTPVKILALALGLAGVAAVLFGRYGRFDLLPEGQLEGPIGATGAAILGAGIAVLTRAARTVYRPVDLAIVSGLLMVAWNALLHPIADLGRVPDLTLQGWIAAIFMGVFGLGVAFLTWATALARLPAVTAAMYLFLSSLLAALWGWIFDDTPIGWPFFAGAGFVLSGLLLMAQASRRGGAAPRSMPAPATPPDPAAPPAQRPAPAPVLAHDPAAPAS